mmetsp:Transcript_13539/g.56875  ORF Transcript_13539/g.56875 Transcript_13539/m.56875 type:complete len:252 (-) Transcript_13539:646-1401(-)
MSAPLATHHLAASVRPCAAHQSSGVSPSRFFTSSISSSSSCTGYRRSAVSAIPPAPTNPPLIAANKALSRRPSNSRRDAAPVSASSVLKMASFPKRAESMSAFLPLLSRAWYAASGPPGHACASVRKHRRAGSSRSTLGGPTPVAHAACSSAVSASASFAVGSAASCAPSLACRKVCVKDFEGLSRNAQTSFWPWHAACISGVICLGPLRSPMGAPPATSALTASSFPRRHANCMAVTRLRSPPSSYGGNG